MPGALAIILGFVLIDVPKFDQELGEGHLFLRWLLRVKLGRRLSIGVSSETRLGVQGCDGFEPVGSLVLRISQSLLQVVIAHHPVVDSVHVHWKFTDGALVIKIDVLVVELGVLHASQLLIEAEDR